MKPSMPTALPMLAWLAASAACSGSLSGSTDKPSVLATIHGTVEALQSGSPDGSNPLAVAIVWQKVLPGSTQVVSTSVPIKPTFPSSFSLDLAGLPPDSAMTDLAALNCGNPPCPNQDAGPRRTETRCTWSTARRPDPSRRSYTRSRTVRPPSPFRQGATWCSVAFKRLEASRR